MYEFVDYLCMLDKSTQAAAKPQPGPSGADTVVASEAAEGADPTLPVAERGAWPDLPASGKCQASGHPAA